MIIPKEEIQAFIPQRTPFIMIDNLLEANDDRIVTDFHVLPDNIFLEGPELREFALIENIAQSSAAGLAFLNKDSRNSPVEGFIGGISRLIVYELPRVNDKIHTVVNSLSKLKNMYLLKGENFVGDRKVMECRVKLVGVRPKSIE